MGVKESKEGMIIISCKDNESIEKLREHNTMGTNYEINTPKIKMKQIKIWGLSELCSEEEIIDKITRCNELITTDSMINVARIKETTPRGIMIILEADEITHNRFIISSDRIYLDWDICRVYEYVHVTRCFTSTYCKNFGRCGICSMGDHETSDCKSDSIKCVNCVSAKERMRIDIDDNHKAWDMSCPVYTHKVDAE